MTLAFASLFGAYLEPSDDLWLPAHRKQIAEYSDQPLNSPSSFTTYVQDNEVSVLACLEQVQICNPFASSSSKYNLSCTTPHSFSPSLSDMEYVLSTTHQKALATALLPITVYSTFAYTITDVKMLAESLVIEGSSLPLAPEHGSSKPRTGGASA